MSALLHKLVRVSEMGRSELLHRARERLRLTTDQARCRLLAAPDPGRRGLEELRAAGWSGPAATTRRYLLESAAPRFYLPVPGAARFALVEVLHRLMPEAVERSLAEAQRLLAGRLPLLGFGEVEVGAEIDWHRDPVSGARWPLRFAGNYDLVAADNPADPKVVHELNRQQHLPRLAKAWLLSGEERFAEAALAQMESWIGQNPRGRGINWSSSLELAMRSLSWLWAIFFLLPYEGLDEARSRRVLGSLFSQLDHVYRFPSLYSSPNTHLIGEAAALFIAGQTFVDLPAAARWRRRGLELLTVEIERQDRDGVHAELSSCYHCYAVDFYLHAFVLADRNGLSLPVPFRRRLQAELDFVAHLTRADGTLPALGDGDGGRALALGATDYRSFTDALATGALLFRRGDWKWVAGGLREETLWLLGAPAAHAWARLEAAPPERRADHRPSAGYFIQRTGWGGRQAHLVFDCGGLGPLGGGHGHADALSLTLHGPEGDILVDPGTFVYNRDRRWRDWFRSTAAHNTVVIDGCSQSVPDGTFRWSTQARGRPRKACSACGIELVEGEHDGYTTLPGAPRPQRRVMQVGGEYWLVIDELVGGGAHEIELLWHFAPGLHPLRLTQGRGGSIVHAGGTAENSLFGLTVCASAPFDAAVIRGNLDPPQGWVSYRYGERQPAPVLRVALRTPLPARFVTVLAPFGSTLAQGMERRALSGSQADPAPMRVRRLRAPAGAVALGLEQGGTTDWLLASPGTEDVELGDARLRGEVVWLRTRHGRIERFFARNARTVEHKGWALLRSATPVPSCARDLSCVVPLAAAR